MEQEIKYDRPNTVSGLVAKRKELLTLRNEYRAEIRKLTADMAHLEAAIRMFEPDAQTFVVGRRIPKGAMKRFLLSALREAPEPMTSRELAVLWVQECGLEQTEANLLDARKKVSACIKDNVRQGLIEACGQSTDHGANGPYKLWHVLK